MEFLGPTGSEELQNALGELLEVARRSVESFRLAEQVVQDHRIGAAMQRLRLHHEGHADELAALLAELGGRPVAPDGAADAGPVGDAVMRGEITGAALLEALRRAEAELCAAYERHSGRGYLEPIQTVLMRHRREEEAHEAWLHESELWQPGAWADASAPNEGREMPAELAADAPLSARFDAPERDIAEGPSQWAARGTDREGAPDASLDPQLDAPEGNAAEGPSQWTAPSTVDSEAAAGTPFDAHVDASEGDTAATSQWAAPGSDREEEAV